MVFGNLGQMGDMLKKANEMRKNMKEIQKKLASELVVGESGGISITVSGDMEIKEVKVDPAVIKDGNMRRLEMCIKDAANRALGDAKKVAANQFKGLTGGLDIPGLM